MMGGYLLAHSIRSPLHLSGASLAYTPLCSETPTLQYVCTSVSYVAAWALWPMPGPVLERRRRRFEILYHQFNKIKGGSHRRHAIACALPSLKVDCVRLIDSRFEMLGRCFTAKQDYLSHTQS